MKETICAQCGERNEFDAEFCVACQSFLSWHDDTPGGSETTQYRPRPDSPDQLRDQQRQQAPPPGETARSGPAEATLILGPTPRDKSASRRGSR
jgi:hypothetical protein